MKKTSQVDEDEQLIRRVRQCLRKMSGNLERRQLAATRSPKSEADPFTDLRQILDNAGLLYGKSLKEIKKEHGE